jgi:AcrR family transcriptional regulator
MAAKGEDRRIARTRAALRRALVELILEQGYESVTVQQIIDRANVGRSTFYAHYLDKQQLLLDSLRELRGMLTRHQHAAVAVQGSLAQGRLAFSRAMFEHAAGHAQLYRAVVGKQSGAIVQREIQQILDDMAREELAAATPPGRQASIPLDVLVPYVVSAFMGLLIWWLEAGLPYSVSEVDGMFQRLVLPGISAALDLPHRPA